MNTLFVSRVNPFLKNGGAYATKAYIDAFNELSDKFTLMIPGDDKKENDHGDYEIITVPERSFIHKILYPFTGISNRFIPFIYKLAKTNNNFSDYDTIVLNGGVLAGSMVKYFKALNKNVITLHHNVELNYHYDNKTIDSFWGHCNFHVRRNERKALLNSDLNLSISQSDMEELRKIYSLGENVKIDYLGCFEDRDRQTTYLLESNIHNKAVITGSLGDLQTTKSIFKFLEEEYSVFKEVLPEWELTIAGRNPSEELKTKLDSLGITLKPNPENMDEIIRQSSLYICPTYLGSGLKLRIMDGLRNGLPIITHEVSARGYECFYDSEFFKVYSTPDQFRRALINITNPEFPKEQIASSYNAHFSYNAGLNRLKGALTKAHML